MRPTLHWLRDTHASLWAKGGHPARSRRSAPRPCLDRNHRRALFTRVLWRRRRLGGRLREARRL